MSLNKPEPKPTTPKPTVAETQAKRMSMKQKVGLTLGTLALGLGTTLPSFGTEKAPVQSNLETQQTTEHVTTNEAMEVTQAPTVPIQIAQAETHKHAYHFKNDAERDVMFKKVAREAGAKADSVFVNEVSKLTTPHGRRCYSDFIRGKSKGKTNYGTILDWYKSITSSPDLKNMPINELIKTIKTTNSSFYDLSVKELQSVDHDKKITGKADMIIANAIMELLKINLDSNLND
jgi:hypothetical protein